MQNRKTDRQTDRQAERADQVGNAHQAMLYGAGVPNEDMMKNAPQVGIATIWWEGNPCK